MPRYGPKIPAPRPASPVGALGSATTSPSIARTDLTPISTPPSTPSTNRLADLKKAHSSLARSVSPSVSDQADDESPLPSDDEDGDVCCAACAHEMLHAAMAPVLAQRSLSASTAASTEPPVNGTDDSPVPGSKKKNKKKKQQKKKNKTEQEEEEKMAAVTSEILQAPLAGLVDGNIFGLDRSQRDEKRYRNNDNWLPMSGIAPPKSCPPDRCTFARPNYPVWHWLDGLLYETCLAAFKCESQDSSCTTLLILIRSSSDELIYNMAEPLTMIRLKLARQYLQNGGRMTTDDGHPKDMDSFIRLAEPGIWSSVLHPEVQAFTKRTLAVALIKLVSVFVSRAAVAVPGHLLITG